MKWDISFDTKMNYNLHVFMNIASKKIDSSFLCLLFRTMPHDFVIFLPADFNKLHLYGYTISDFITTKKFKIWQLRLQMSNTLA